MMTNGCKYLSLAVILIVWAGYGCSGDSGTSVKPCKQTGSCPDTTVGPAPVLNDIQPESGAIGATVTLTGKNFSSTNAENNVTFGNLDANIVSASETTLEVIVPQGATTGSVQVAVNGKSSGVAHFIVTSGTRYNFHSDYAYNLNVIYFVPTNLDTMPNFRHRLSGVLIYIQKYYRKWMKHWGYGNKTFGLLKDKGQIKITVVKGDHPSSQYPNKISGSNKIKNEVRTYFNSHEVTRSSKHYLVFTPKPNSSLDLPFFDSGRWGFVSDFGIKASRAGIDGGGIVHELGHALNLPHNDEPKDRQETLGTSIMSDGNYVWANDNKGSEETSLTHVSCAILNESQVFSRNEKNFYGSVNSQLKTATGKYINGRIVIDGKFKSDVPVTNVIVVLNPPKSKGYNQIGFSRSVEDGHSFHFSIDPNTKLYKIKNAMYGLKLWMVYKNGVRTTKNLPDFSFKDGIPDINFQFGAVSTLPKDDWRIIDYSDQETQDGDKRAVNIIDGDSDTYWASRYSGQGKAQQPHHITIDMGASHTVKGFQIIQRANNNNNRTKKLEIQISGDGDNWQNLGNFILKNTHKPQQIKLNSSKIFQYFKLTMKSDWAGQENATLAEVGIY